MRYTVNNSVKDIINDNLLSTTGFFTQSYVDSNSSELDLPLKDLYNPPYPECYAGEVISAINMLLERIENKEEVFIPLWEGLSENEMENTKESYLIPFLIDKTSPCFIVCPGGGYEAVCMTNEGVATALELNSYGYNAVILSYRVAPNQYPTPQQDLIRAIRYVRAHSKKFNLYNDQVVLMGYSAAGHLCGSVAALYNEIEDSTHAYDHISARPDALVLCYPVISFIKNPHVGSADNLLGKEANYEERASKSVENLITENYPPTFLWHCEADDLVPCSNSVTMAEALSKHNIPHKLCIYPNGGHGCSLAKGSEAEGWFKEALEFAKLNLLHVK